MSRKYYFEDDNAEKGMLFSFDLAEHDKQIRAEVIEKVKKYIRLKTKYAEHSKDDYVLAHEMYDWLDEQSKEQKINAT